MHRPDGDPPVGDALFRLDGTVALITGAGGAFGRALAPAFVRAGATVFLSEVDRGALEAVGSLAREAGGEPVLRVADTGAAADVEGMFHDLDTTLGRIDVLVNNAGVNPHQGRPEVFPVEVWEQVLRTNLTGYLLCAQSAARRMISAGRGGSIINVSSIAAVSALGRGNLAYGVSKAGVSQLTRELAVEWAQHGIRVNAILPCQFVNAGLAALVADPTRSATVERMLAGIPLGRMGQPPEIVGPVLFLASGASSMVTGVNLPVDGGNLALNPGGSLPTPS